jgi:hypothetical protein
MGEMAVNLRGLSTRLPPIQCLPSTSTPSTKDRIPRSAKSFDVE